MSEAWATKIKYNVIAFQTRSVEIFHTSILADF